MPSIAAAAIGGVASIAGGLISGGAAKSAADTQAQAANNAAAAQMAMFNTVQANMAPYMRLGSAAAPALGFLLGLPGYGNALSTAPGAAPAAAPPAISAPAPAPGVPTSGTGGAGGLPAGWSIAQGDAGPMIIDQQGNPVATFSGGVWNPQGILSGSDLTGFNTAIAPLQPGATLAQTSTGALPLAPPAPTAGGAPAPAAATPGSFNGFGFGALTTPFPQAAPFPAFQPFNPTMSDLAKTPGYQFTLQQGLQATQNSAAAQGLGSSGSALKGAANYAAGLASTTYQQQFQNYWTTLQNQFGQYWSNLNNQFQQYWGNRGNISNLLSGAVQSGQGAAAGVSTAGLNTANVASNFLTSGAAATAAGTVGAANALTSGFGGATSAGTNALLLNALFNGNNSNTTVNGINVANALSNLSPVDNPNSQG